MTEDDILDQIERGSARRVEVVRAMLMTHRPDVLLEFDGAIRDLRLGLTSARNAWHSISPAQRRALQACVDAGHLVKNADKRSRYDIPGGAAAALGISTIRKLIAHDMLDCDGGALDPEERVVASERGRFIVKHGQPADEMGKSVK